mmetsp:Transcript_2044/g.13205  ORF Transcript_2044/g.13205 Transcript_2044/m.13205 type:complete len:205 (-) Transcript_2044:2830-3444(-)
MPTISRMERENKKRDNSSQQWHLELSATCTPRCIPSTPPVSPTVSSLRRLCRRRAKSTGQSCPGSYISKCLLFLRIRCIVPCLWANPLDLSRIGKARLLRRFCGRSMGMHAPWKDTLAVPTALSPSRGRTWIDGSICLHHSTYGASSNAPDVPSKSRDHSRRECLVQSKGVPNGEDFLSHLQCRRAPQSDGLDQFFGLLHVQHC